MADGVLWLLGGLDPTGGAGLHRDWATAQAVRPKLATRSVVTALTVQGHGGPAQGRAVDDLAWQLDVGPRPAAIKIGLVPAAVVGDVAAFLRRHPVPVVLDPVLRASDGGALGSDAVALGPLIELATVVTPNRDEASLLPPADGQLRKDVDGDPSRVTDVLIYRGAEHRFERARQPGPDVRGTGCALATAIAAMLATGDGVVDAVRASIEWLDEARRHAVERGGEFHLSSI